MIDHECLIKKAHRLERSRSVQVRLRPAVHEFYATVCREKSVGLPLLLRGILEDYYDRHKADLPGYQPDDSVDISSDPGCPRPTGAAGPDAI